MVVVIGALFVSDAAESGASEVNIREEPWFQYAAISIVVASSANRHSCGIDCLQAIHSNILRGLDSSAIQFLDDDTKKLINRGSDAGHSSKVPGRYFGKLYSDPVKRRLDEALIRLEFWETRVLTEVSKRPIIGMIAMYVTNCLQTYYRRIHGSANVL